MSAQPHEPAFDRTRPADPDTEVRAIRPADHERVGTLLVDAYRAAGPFDDGYLGRLARPQDWVGGASEVFVAERRGQVMGVVAFTRPGDDHFEPAHLRVADSGFRFLATDPASQGTGIGNALVRACLDAGREHGCRRLLIYTMAFMTAAHRLYEREGFIHRADLDVVFPAGPGYAYQRDLSDDAPEHFPPPGPIPAQPPWFEDAWAR